MRLSIFNSSTLKLLVFLSVLVFSGAALELYCRSASRFQSSYFVLIRHFADSDPTNAVFGDSHILWVSRIPGFSFYGTAGEQPSEFKRLVEFLYASTPPKKIILQADPQWFGQYHVGREEFITADNLPSRKIPLMLTSSYYLKSLKSSIISDFENTVAKYTTSARADDDPEKKWIELSSKPGFNWTWLTENERLTLTTLRVGAQNPRDNFESGPAAKDFESGISFLIARGATLCLFRTPVTSSYLDTAERIKNSNYAAFDRYIHKIARVHNIQYIDFRSLPYEFTDEKFLNADHLTNEHSGEMWPLVTNACF
jgi:hypothetical protein